MWKKKDSLTKVQERVSKIDTPSLTSWAENSLFGIGKCITSYQRSREAADLEEALLGAECLYAVMQELMARSSNAR